jgi:hypothetical protein
MLPARRECAAQARDRAQNKKAPMATPINCAGQGLTCHATLLWTRTGVSGKLDEELEMMLKLYQNRPGLSMGRNAAPP